MATPCTKTIFSVLATVLALSAGQGAIATEVGADEQARAAEGKKLVASSACEKCHAVKLGGDGSAMYLRKERKVTSKSKLVAQVARCSSELSLGLFPEDEAAIATYLNLNYYKFKD